LQLHRNADAAFTLLRIQEISDYSIIRRCFPGCF
jgi:hypothetical protein